MAYADIRNERNGQLENRLSIPSTGNDFSRRMHNGSGFHDPIGFADLPVRGRLEAYS
jgi:hypothetical protein